MKVRKNGVFVKYILHILGLLVCAAPPIIATLFYFPVWRTAGSAQMISGGTALLIIIAAIPFYKYIRKLFESAAAYMIWLLIFLFCYLLSSVIGEITVISFIGFVSNLLGGFLIKLGDIKQGVPSEKFGD